MNTLLYGESTRNSSRGKPRLLDLFCCAGGAGIGYTRAGFEVIGVDIKPQPNYPLSFIQTDALQLDPKFIASFDAVHASPRANHTLTLPRGTRPARRRERSRTYVRCRTKTEMAATNR